MQEHAKHMPLVGLVEWVALFAGFFQVGEMQYEHIVNRSAYPKNSSTFFVDI